MAKLKLETDAENAKKWGAVENQILVDMVVKAEAGGERGWGSVSINGVAVEAQTPELWKNPPVNDFWRPDTRGHKGLHIVVLNQHDGEVQLSRVFETNRSPDDLDDFINDLREVGEGRIIAVGCDHDWAKKLSWKAICWFTLLGSWVVQRIKPPWCGFAFIGIIGSREPVEKIATKPEGARVSVSKTFKIV